jgi:hypothetical protein
MRFRTMMVATLGALLVSLAFPAQGIASPAAEPAQRVAALAPGQAQGAAPESLGQVAASGAITERCHNELGTRSYCIAYANPSDGYIPCPSGYVCLYSNTDFKGTQVRWPSGHYFPNFDNIPCELNVFDCMHGGAGFNDETTSWSNRTDRLYCVTKDVGAQFPNNDMPNTGFNQGPNIGSEWNDVVSALSYLGC